MTNVNTAALREMLTPNVPIPWNRRKEEVVDADGHAIGNFYGPKGDRDQSIDLICAAVNALPTLLDNTDRLAALEAGMRGLELRWRSEADDLAFPDENERDVIEAEDAMRVKHADELSALLNRPADGGE